jgi:murein DD-endopeptidase MepM/ murein hydrolase activator NlpD
VAGVALLGFAGLVVLLAAPAAANGSTWRRPVDGTVLRAFVVGADRFARGSHRGVDLDAPLGASVRAACGGRVAFAGRVPAGGLTLSVRCGELVATYQHLQSIVVRRGQVVGRGAVLGGVGRSGAPRSRRPHLHLGAREAASGRYVDPMSLIGDGSPVAPPLPPRAPSARRLAPRAPSARPLPLGPAPAARPMRARAVRFSRPLGAPAAPVPARGVPLTVWAGVACLALGLPLGGIVTVRRRRLRRALAHVVQSA